MKRALTRLIFADCLFVMFLSLSSFLGGTLEWPIYAIAFIVPTLLILSFQREEDFKISVFSSSSFSFVSLVAIFPIIFLVFIISFSTSLFMGAIGIEGNTSEFSGNILHIILISAFAPAVFEEMLFRYLPARLLGGYSKKLTVIYSAILFAVSHGNVFQIPYALFAGAAFMTLDVVCGSVLPSIFIHFLNNILSILWQRECESLVFCIIFIVSLFVLSLISLILICFNCKKVKDSFSPIFKDKSKVIFTNQLIFYITAMLFVSMSSFII